MTQWHYSRNGQENGPVSSSELKQLAARGQLLPTDTLQRDGLGAWIPATRVKGLFASVTSDLPQGNIGGGVSSTESSTMSPEESMELLASDIAGYTAPPPQGAPPDDLGNYRQRLLWFGVPTVFGAIWIVWFAFIHHSWQYLYLVVNPTFFVIQTAIIVYLLIRPSRRSAQSGQIQQHSLETHVAKEATTVNDEMLVKVESQLKAIVRCLVPVTLSAVSGLVTLAFGMEIGQIAAAISLVVGFLFYLKGIVLF